MSLKPEPIGPIPQETVRLAKAVFPEGSTFMKMRDELGTLYQDEMFVALFPKAHGLRNEIAPCRESAPQPLSFTLRVQGWWILLAC